MKDLNLKVKIEDIKPNILNRDFYATKINEKNVEDRSIKKRY